ncbi:phage protease [Shewanella algae]|uniref:phage protease n=1 Tax=Shewanella algae TaxID=38313 RepID=UPI0031F4BDF4
MNRYLALCFQLPETLPDWVLLIPAGQFVGRDGRTWVNSAPDSVIAASTPGETPWDVEHATEIKGPKGEEAPAYGWFESFENRDGAIWGKVAFNREGQALIENKSYRFYSPAFFYDSQGRVTALSSCGFTNKPNLKLPALNREDETMKLPPELAAALGLAETATAADAVTAIAAMKQEQQVALNRAGQVDLNKYVPKETYDLALNRATTAEQQLADKESAEHEALVDEAISAGKVAPQNKDMYLGLCRAQEGRQQFAEFIKTAPAIVDGKTVKTTNTAPSQEIDPEELALCHKMGVSKEDFLAAKANMQQGA